MSVTIDLDDFDASELETLRVEYYHNDSGLEEVEVCKCCCKVVYNYAHLATASPPPHYVGCPAPKCNGVKAQMHGSAYVFPCEDHFQF